MLWKCIFFGKNGRMSPFMSAMSGFGKDDNLVPFALGKMCIGHSRQP
jgi:hypothetical protein